MSKNKFQKFYVNAVYKANISDNINNIKVLFKEEFSVDIKLSKEDFYKEKFKALGNINKLTMEELAKKIACKNIDVNVKVIDVFYE